MKYIIYNNKEGRRQMVLFDKGQNHSEVLAALGTKAISAGFCKLKIEKCYGKSFSLKVKTRPVDKDYIQIISDAEHPGEKEE